MTRLVCVCAVVWVLAAACGGGPSPQARTAALTAELNAKLDVFDVPHVAGDVAAACADGYEPPSGRGGLLGSPIDQAVWDLAAIDTYCPQRVALYLAALADHGDSSAAGYAAGSGAAGRFAAIRQQRRG